MDISNKALEVFRSTEHELFYEIIKNNKLVTKEKAEDIVYALYTISELIDEIYIKKIPKLIGSKTLSSDEIKEIFHEIKFNCNEIRQLIETAKLTDLKYWDDSD